MRVAQTWLVLSCLGGLGCTPSGAPTTCTIDGTTYQANVTNPDPEFGTCQKCVPTTAQVAWTNEPLGTACGNGLVCIAQGKCSRNFRRLSSGASGTFYDVAGSSADEVWAVGPATVAYRSTNKGASFTPVTVPGLETRFGVFALGPGQAIVVGSAGSIIETQNAGDTWTRRPAPMRQVLRGIWGGSANDLFVVGGDGYVARSTNGGQSWNELRSTADAGVSLALNAVWGNDQAVYAVGEGGIILRSTDRASFSRAGITTNAEFKAVYGNAAGVVLVAGSAGSVWRTRDGAAWENLARPTTDDISDLWGIGDEFFLTTEDGRIYRTTDSGDRWVQVASAGAQSLNAVWGTSLEDVYAVGSTGTVLHLP